LKRTTDFLIGAGIASALGYVAFLGPDFLLEDPKSRPVLAMISAFGVASILYLIACWRWVLSSQSVGRKSSLGCIVGFAILFRLILLFTNPILEIDLYRYIWDGNVAATTGDPYEYAPVEFIQWQYAPEYRIPFTRSEEEAQWIRSFSEEQGPGIQKALRTIHYGQYTSPYPPVSQFFFALSQSVCPKECSVQVRVIAIKGMLILFDLAVGVLLILILRRMNLPGNYSVAWFWSPLVLKEFANSGHLDTIAIFFAMLSVLFMVRQMQAVSLRKGIIEACCVAAFLALGIGAKVFPIVLVPLWTIMTLRKIGFAAVIPGLVVVLLTSAIMAPMMLRVRHYQQADRSTVMPEPGILAFTKSWEINDMIFMFVFENIRPLNEAQSPWFAFTSKGTRAAIVSSFQSRQAEEKTDLARANQLNEANSLAFRVSRLITTALFALLLIGLAVRWWRTDPEQQTTKLLNGLFLSLAWFWLLSPTQNPWYWCWAIPLLPFAKAKTWYLVAALTLLYYTRFHFENHGLPMERFHFYVPFVEFVPVLVLLTAESLLNRFRDGQKNIA
jgi:hypothetical protein